MNKRLKLLLVVPFVVLFSLAMFRKNIPTNHYPESNSSTPILLATSLADTLGEVPFQKLHIANVEGIKVKYPSGDYASYFEYEADDKVVIDVISIQPFSKYASIADTKCRAIAFDELKQLKSSVSGFEYENSGSFWNVQGNDFEVYECLKAPLKHTVLLDKKSNRVLHRVEFKA